MPQIKVYGADWCGHTRSTLAHLDQLGVEYEYIDVEKNRQASDWVKRQNNGKEKKPTLDIAGQILTGPDDEEVDEALRREQLMPA